MRRSQPLAAVDGFIVAIVAAVATVELTVAPLYHLDFTLGVAVAVALYGFGLGAAAAIFIGVPGHLLLASQGRTSLASYVMVGAVAGIAPSILVTMSGIVEQDAGWKWSEYGRYVSWGALGIPAGIVGAIVFWYLVIRASPQAIGSKGP